MNPTSPEHADREPAIPLRVGTYNLLNGSGDRWPGQMDLLASLDLDILCLQEAKDWDRNLRERLYATAERLRLCPQFAPSAWHGSHLVTLYRSSRLTCIGFTPDVASSKFHHRMSRSVFKIPGLDGDPTVIDVIHTHLDPFDPQDRLGEVAWLTEHVAPGPYTLLVGNLNSIGAGDAEPDDWSKVPAHLQSRHRLVLPDGTYGGVDRRAINVLMAAGYVDPPAYLDTPVPRTAGYWSDTERWGHRSDHILTSPRLAPSLHAYTVVDNPQARSLSDHLPVVTTHDLARYRTATGPTLAVAT